MRNAIIHCNGLIGLKENDVKSVESLPGVLRDEDSESLELTPEFCEGVLEFCRSYVVELKDIAIEIARKAKCKVTLVT